MIKFSCWPAKIRASPEKVLHVFPKKNRALVEGVNMVKKNLRKSQRHPQGGMISQELPIQMSNLNLVCPTSGKPTRISTIVANDGTKQRVSAKNKAVIS